MIDRSKPSSRGQGAARCPGRPRAAALALVVPLLALVSTPSAARDVGRVEFARGVTVAQQPDGSAPRLVGRGSKLQEGDVVKTSARSFAVLRLDDGTRMTLRPESAFTVEQMDAEAEEPSAIMRLFRGGLRAITGFISKRNPDGVRLHTPVVTMGVRGTEFDARLCDEACARENEQLAATRATAEERRSQVIGRVAFARGSLSARAYAGDSRPLSPGGPVYEGDTLETGSRGFAVVALRDRGRVTLQPGTEFRIDELRFEPAEPERGSVLMRLLRGGLRVVSGLIGQARKEAYRMRTPVATIGIRGTGYDLLCQGECVSADSAALEPPPAANWLARLLGGLIRAAQAQALPGGDGLFTYVWQGAVEVELDTGTVVVGENEAVFLSHPAAPPVRLPVVPEFIRDNPAPRPDTLDIDQDELFGGQRLGQVPPGLYVNVRDGHIRLQGELGRVVNLGRGEAAFAALDRALPVRLDLVLPFLAFDRFPTPDQVDPQVINLIGRTIATAADEELQCEVR